MGKVIWIDTETTGLNSKKHALIELAAIVELDGREDNAFSIKFKPENNKEISPQALKVNGRCIEELVTFPETKTSYLNFKGHLQQYVNRFDPEDKFVIAGYNVGFDINFLRQLFLDCHDKFFGSFFFNCHIDVMHELAKKVSKNGFRLPNYKLITACEYYDIPLDAHDPVSDIRATRNLFNILNK